MAFELYVDGSFMKRSKRAGWGWVLVANGKPLARGYGLTYEAALSRNIDGELAATMEGVNYFLDCFSVKELTIVHDYLGIAKWVTGEWAARKPVSTNYLDFMKKAISDGLELKFRHVRGHSGDKWNEEADRLAKLAITERYPDE